MEIPFHWGWQVSRKRVPISQRLLLAGHPPQIRKWINTIFPSFCPLCSDETKDLETEQPAQALGFQLSCWYLRPLPCSFPSPPNTDPLFLTISCFSFSGFLSDETQEQEVGCEICRFHTRLSLCCRRVLVLPGFLWKWDKISKSAKCLVGTQNMKVFFLLPSWFIKYSWTTALQPGFLFIFWPKREARMFVIHYTGRQWTGVRNVYVRWGTKKLEVAIACNSLDGGLLQKGDLSLRYHSGAFFILLLLLWKSPL